MVGHIVASHRRAARRRFVASAAATLAAHAALLGSVAWASHGPHAVLQTPRPVTLAWPERSEPVAPLPVAAVRVPDADPLVLPPEVTIGLPPTTAALRFDPRVPTVPHGPGDAVGAPRDSRDPWSAALVDEQPALLAGPTPLYPESLRRAGIAGRVVVEAVLDTLGHAEPGSVRTVTSPDPGFVAPARHYVLQAVFRPARVHGHAVRVLVRVPIDFTLAGLQ